MKRVIIILGTILIAISMLTVSSLAATGTINTDRARIRQRATTDSPEVSIATRGERVEVIGEENGWYQVKFENVTGYIRADLISTDYTAPATTPEPTPPVDTTPTEPTTAEPVTTEPIGTATTEPVPAETTTPEATPVSPETPAETNSFVERKVTIGESVTLDREVSLRYLPNFHSRVSSNIASGNNVTIKDELNHWIKVTDGNVTGWILKADISENQQATPEAPITPSEPAPAEQQPETNAIDPTPAPLSETKKGHVNVQSAVVREEPDGKKITSLPQNTVVEIIGEVEDWYEINVEGYNGYYIAKRLITID